MGLRSGRKSRPKRPSTEAHHEHRELSHLRGRQSATDAEIESNQSQARRRAVLAYRSGTLMRPTRDEVLMETARLWAHRGTCNRLRVGAIFSRNGRILVQGYNGAPSG